MPNKLKIHINGMHYAITTEESPSYVAGLAQEIDTMVRTLMQQGNISMNEALLLSALSSLDEAKKAENGADHLRGQVSDYAEEAARLRAEMKELRRENERLERRLAGKQDKST